MNNKKYNPFADMYNFNANSSNWVQRLGHNADFYNNPLGYNSSPTPRPYDNTTVFGADDDNEVVSGFKPQTPRTTSLSNGFNVNKQQPSMGNIASFNLKGNNDASDFNTGSNNFSQRLGHNADFYNNPLGYNSSPTPRPYKIASNDTPMVNNNKKVDYSAYGEGFSKEFIDKMLDDKRFNNIMNSRVINNEGGYVNHPNDLGGETKYGITSKWYPNEDIKNLTRERANAILYRDYWQKTNIHQLPDEFADIVFDDSIVQGQPTAIRNLQKALGVNDDGIIGPKTLKAFQHQNHNIIRTKFIKNVNDVENENIKNNPSQKVFEKGHRNRFNAY